MVSASLNSNPLFTWQDVADMSDLVTMSIIKHLNDPELLYLWVMLMLNAYYKSCRYKNAIELLEASIPHLPLANRAHLIRLKVVFLVNQQTGEICFLLSIYF